MARDQKWTHVEFECDSLILCNDVFDAGQPKCCAVSSFVVFIRASLAEFREWKIAWVPKRCNGMSRNLAKWAAHLGKSGFFTVSDILSITRCVICSLVSSTFSFNKMRYYLAK